MNEENNKEENSTPPNKKDDHIIYENRENIEDRYDDMSSEESLSTVESGKSKELGEERAKASKTLRRRLNGLRRRDNDRRVKKRVTKRRRSLVRRQGGSHREREEVAGCACGGGRDPPPAPSLPHTTLRALDLMPPPILRSNPLYTEEEEQEVVIIVDSPEESVEGEAPEVPRTPRRAPSTSSGYGSGGGSHGRVSPNLPKREFHHEPAQRSPSNSVSDKQESRTTSDSESPECTLSRSLKEDIRSCLGGCRWEKDVGDVVEAAVRGAGGITAARARLHAALLALHEPLPRLPNRGPSLPYCGPGVRPGDVTMMPKNTEMSLLAASALFTLDGARGEALSRRLARGERNRRRCRVALAVIALILLLAAVGAVELLMSRGQRVFGAVLR